MEGDLTWKSGAGRETLLSLALGAAGILLLALQPHWLAEGRPLGDRAGLALLLVGVVGCLAHGLGLRPARQPARSVCRPGLAWPLLAAGAAWLLVVAG